MGIDYQVDLNVSWNDSYIQNAYADDSYIQDVYANYEPFDPADISREMRKQLLTIGQPLTIVLTVMYCIVFSVGLVGNVFVILVVFRHQRMRTLTNVFLVNLTIGDLMVVCVCIPITLGNYVYRNWIYGDVMCKITPLLQGTAVAVSVLTLLCVGINRYIAIHTPLKAKLLFSKTRVYIILALIWVFSLATFMPLLQFSKLTTFGIEGIFQGKACEEKWPSLYWKRTYNIGVFVVLFVLPVIVMCVTYVKIGLTLWHADATLVSREVLTMSIKRNGRLLKQRRKTVKMLISLVILFACSWLPYYVVNIWLDFNLNSRETLTIITYVYPMVQILGLSNSTVNPICYCFMSRSFRRAFLTLCCVHKTKIGKRMISYKCNGASETSAAESIETMME